MKKKTAIFLSGAVWAVVGVWLLYKGLRLLSLSVDREAGSWWMAGGLLVGFIKGRFVLAKTVKRIAGRIDSLSEPIQLKTLYPKSYWLLLGSMSLLGFVLQFFPIDWRAFIDVAVGSALINGAMLYFRWNKRSLSV